MKKKYGENHLRKEEKESSKKGMNKKNRYEDMFKIPNLYIDTIEKSNKFLNKIKNHFEIKG